MTNQKFEVIGWNRVKEHENVNMIRADYQYNGKKDYVLLFKEYPKRKDVAKAIKKKIEHDIKEELKTAKSCIDYWEEMGDLRGDC